MVRRHRSGLGYHAALDHYGFMFKEMAMLEWARDPAKNDKDLVVILPAKGLIDAGLDASRFKAGLFAPAGKDDMGKDQAARFLFPYDGR
jgi:hypothetical protein